MYYKKLQNSPLYKELEKKNALNNITEIIEKH